MAALYETGVTWALYDTWRFVGYCSVFACKQWSSSRIMEVWYLHIYVHSKLLEKKTEFMPSFSVENTDVKYMRYILINYEIMWQRFQESFLNNIITFLFRKEKNRKFRIAHYPNADTYIICRIDDAHWEGIMICRATWSSATSTPLPFQSVTRLIMVL